MKVVQIVKLFVLVRSKMKIGRPLYHFLRVKHHIVRIILIVGVVNSERR